MRLVFRIFLLLVVVHFGIAAGTPYVLHRFLDMRVEEIGRSAGDRSEDWVRGEILEYAREKRIPLDGRDVLVWRNRSELRIYIAYEQTVRIPFHRYDVLYQTAYPEGTIPPRRYAGRMRSASGR